MRTSKMILIGVCVAALAGCATAQVAKPPVPLGASAPAPETSNISEINAKLDNAIAIANAGGDAAGAACWSTTKTWVNTLPIPAGALTLPPAIGVSGDIETARIKVAATEAKVKAVKLALAAGVPEVVHNACAPLWINATLVGAKIIGVLGLIPQTGIAAAGTAGLGAAAAVLKAQ